MVHRFEGERLDGLLKSVFFVERKLTDNLFIVQLSEDGAKYAVRMYPFAVFAVDDVPEDEVMQLALVSDLYTDVVPFSYAQPLLILTTQCNLSCTYCYAHEGTYGLEATIMSEEVVNRSIAYLRRIISSRYLARETGCGTTELGLICFGGEPTIAMNLIQLAHCKLSALCEELSSERMRFTPTLTINTNGYQLKQEVFDFMVIHAADIEVVVSYDGLSHDECRVTKTGAGTAVSVFGNIIRLHKAGVKVAVTSCVLPELVRDPSQFIAGMSPLCERGIPINPSFIRGPLEGVSDRAVYPGLVQEQYDTDSLDRFGGVIVHEIAQGAPFYSARFRRRLLEGGYRYRCGAGLYEFAVTPDGSVYPCHNFVSGTFSLGNICDEGYSIPECNPLLQSLLHRNVNALEPCARCVFQSTCMSSFDCPAHSLQDLGEISRVDNRFCGFARQVQAVIVRNFIEEMENVHT